jgi:hypothetical protein
MLLIRHRDNFTITSPDGNIYRNIGVISEISGSHGGEYEDDCLLGCYAV